MTKIYINGRFLTQKVTGVQRYANEIVNAFDQLIENGEIPKKYELVVLVPNNVQRKIVLKNIEIRTIGKLKGHLWEQIELPLYTKKHFLLNLCNLGPAFKKNQIVSIHDASVFLNENNYSKLFTIWYKILYKLESKNAKLLITVSNFSCKELIKYLHIDNSRIKVIYEGNDHIRKLRTDNKIIKKYKLDSKPYLLSVSSLNPNKNFKGVIKSLKYLNKNMFDVVVAGGMNPKVFNGSQIDNSKNVKYLGYVTDEELKALYENAFCFLYPSFYEGFGIPPLEAMSMGCPVIVSNRSSLPEVCGDSALYCEPSDSVDIANKINQLINDENLQNKLKELGQERAQSFSWMNCAHEIFDTLSKEL
ncbi:glycosyltransferase family 4 protein [Sporolactobacillus terrae]|uniref:Group 1 glycosyl transferase n=1 Tax=Sporolactobacillus terrae TaxID=269673 RepID=A0A5K7WW23_9BACL|nr:glycosyltransferase family 1 protein [Sporolactobacillus terrae]BBN97844.1 group 1 glycosyl transferase [Sporolactobacillus terrae]